MQLLKSGLIRGVILFAILLVYSLIYEGIEETFNLYIYNAIIAFLLGLTSIIYQIEQWQYWKQILAHYLSMLITVFPILLISGHYPVNSFSDVWHVYMQFNKAGIALFIVTFVMFNLFRWFGNRNSEEA
ncbi:DUF3021 family protein [Ornithinibacillus halotolerans]|uniref:Uncharacterized protein n=1 Tax=Ornithinibacillus halotolerans TaxID=1274357 RepID=A0A916SAG3_9BACI|nr:DUF3021 family protein [Ornithinibacillus halotolerans]GGA91080.1 hypothetical protein GCM10008025_36990 [Ornithinibacillus halotolerans]